MSLGTCKFYCSVYRVSATARSIRGKSTVEHKGIDGWKEKEEEDAEAKENKITSHCTALLMLACLPLLRTTLIFFDLYLGCKRGFGMPTVSVLKRKTEAFPGR